MSDTQWTPATRYRHDADHLRRLADWLERNAEQPNASVRALDYYRLSESLDELAADARYFANVWTMPIP
jgi:hypothetical protein